ncbi:tetratricopeptide repeat protein [Streptomyces sp. NPDC094437]|uniref:tetratricopeptide repeat protein n=1 Tax=Streptomyces sp. NPDC094437 TaxID=3366060 RepID=UPI00381CDB59
MSRLSRDKKRDQISDRQRGALALAATPVDVRVPARGTAALVGDVPVVAGAGAELQQVVLDHLHRIARTTGRPVLATVHDERIGYVVRLRIETNGSSDLAGEPVKLPARTPSGTRTPEEPLEVPTSRLRMLREPIEDRAPGTALAPFGEFGPPPVMDAVPAGNGTASAPEFAAPPAPQATSDPTQPHPTAPHPTTLNSPPAHGFPPAPASASDQFAPQSPHTLATPLPTPPPASNIPPFPPTPLPTPHPASRPRSRSPIPLLPEPEPEPKVARIRGFDAVAEAVMGCGPVDGLAVLVEPVGRINDAVQAGRTEEAGELARRTVVEATRSLGAEHTEVLRLRELAAYIAYLADDPVDALTTCLDLARIHHYAGDAEGAYSNVLSASTAWRAVRNPEQGLALGAELIDLWTELAAQDGPAAEESERLDSARTRMLRLTNRTQSP